MVRPFIKNDTQIECRTGYGIGSQYIDIKEEDQERNVEGERFATERLE